MSFAGEGAYEGDRHPRVPVQDAYEGDRPPRVPWSGWARPRGILTRALMVRVRLRVIGPRAYVARSLGLYLNGDDIMETSEPGRRRLRVNLMDLLPQSRRTRGG